MNTNSNSYTIIYASIMVVVVAFLLAFVSSSLKEKQYQNVEQDTKKQILAALNVYDVKDVNAEYDKYVKEENIDVLCITNYKRNIFARLFNPSIARKMIFHANTPILVIK